MKEELDKAVMEHRGVTVEQKNVYTYKGYKYENLKDALNYAKIESGEVRKPAMPRT